MGNNMTHVYEIMTTTLVFVCQYKPGSPRPYRIYYTTLCSVKVTFPIKTAIKSEKAKKKAEEEVKIARPF